MGRPGVEGQADAGAHRVELGRDGASWGHSQEACKWGSEAWGRGGRGVAWYSGQAGPRGRDVNGGVGCVEADLPA